MMSLQKLYLNMTCLLNPKFIMMFLVKLPLRGIPNGPTSLLFHHMHHAQAYWICKKTLHKVPWNSKETSSHVPCHPMSSHVIPCPMVLIVDWTVQAYHQRIPDGMELIVCSLQTYRRRSKNRFKIPAFFFLALVLFWWSHPTKKHGAFLTYKVVFPPSYVNVGL